MLSRIRLSEYGSGRFIELFSLCLRQKIVKRIRFSDNGSANAVERLWFSHKWYTYMSVCSLQVKWVFRYSTQLLATNEEMPGSAAQLYVGLATLRFRSFPRCAADSVKITLLQPFTFQQIVYCLRFLMKTRIGSWFRYSIVGVGPST